MQIQSLLSARYLIIALLTTNSDTAGKLLPGLLRGWVTSSLRERWTKLGEKVFYLGWFQKRG
jgi:hypothetical protein